MEGVSVWMIIKLYVVVLASVIRKISTLELAWNDCEFVCKCMCLENKHDGRAIQLGLVHSFEKKRLVGEGQWRVSITRHYWPYESSIYWVAFNYVVSDIAFSSFDIFLRIDGSWAEDTCLILKSRLLLHLKEQISIRVAMNPW